MLKQSKKTLRHSKILTALESDPALRVSELAESLGVSAETIRRDLAELDESGEIKRTYGGAMRSTAFEPDLGVRVGLHIEARLRIAAKAVELINGAEVMFIGGGATTLHFARALRETTRRLYVITPSFSIANELAANPLVQVMALPGLYEWKESMVYGADTIAAISKYHPPVAILGASGVNVNGVSEALMTSAQIYTAMIENADETLFLADASKFEKRALQFISKWQPNRMLISDERPNDQLLDAIVDGGAKWLQADGTS